MYRKLRIARIVVACAVALLIAAGMLWPQTVFGAPARALTRMQFVPAVLAGALFWVLFWLVFTLFFGRLYCSSICPLGTLQDVVARISRSLSRRPRRYSFSSGSLATRIVAILVLVEAFCLGSTLVISWLDPYADFMRLVRVFSAFSLSGLAAAAAVLAVVVAMSWRHGRMLCNTVCPVGAVLGIPAAFSQLRFDINPDLCIHCRRCEDVCKARCINSDRSLVDNTRCVVCFDCVSVCPNNAITWRRGQHRLQWPLLQKAQRTPANACSSSPCSRCSATSSPQPHNNVSRQ